MAAMAQGVQAEIERKYDVNGHVSLPRLRGVGGVARVRYRPPVALHAVYFDTPAKTLAAHRVTLRRRLGGPDAGWHVTIPAGEHRIELHAPLTTADRAAATAGAAEGVFLDGPVRVPARILDVVRVHVRGAPLVPVARLDTLRCVVELMDRSGHRLAEVCDDQVAALTLDGTPEASVQHWREWEVEVIDAKLLDSALRAEQVAAGADAPVVAATDTTVRGAVRFLDTLGEVLESAGARPAPVSSKLEQVLGPVPDPLDPAAIEVPEDGDLDLQSVLTRTVRTQVRRLKGWDPLVRRDVEDSIHQFRVVCRTLRSILQTYAPLLEPEAAAQVNKALRKLGRLLSTARDAEVVRDQVRDRIKALPGGKRGRVAQLVPGTVTKRLEQAKAEEFTTAHDQLLQRMRTQKYLDVLDLLDAYAHQVPLAPPTDQTTDQVTDQIEKADTADHAQAAGATAKTTTGKQAKRQTKKPKAEDKVTAAQGVGPDAVAALEPLAAEQVEAILALARTAAEEADHDHRIELMHEVRKEAKRLRYAVKAVQDATGLDWGADFVDRMTTAKKLQEALGQHRDSIMFQDHVLSTQKKAAKKKKGEDTFGYGLLYAAEFALQQRTEHDAEQLLDRLAGEP